MLDKDISLAEKIQMLFLKQGITIASILTAIGIAIGVLVEVLLPSGTAAGGGTAGKPLPEDDKEAKEWIGNELRALESLPGKLGAKVAEALPWHYWGDH